MLTSLNCLSCFIKHSYDLVCRATDDYQLSETIMREVLQKLSQQDLSQTPPEIVQKLHAIIKRHTGKVDFFEPEKKYYNQLMLKLEPKLTNEIKSARSPFEAAARLAIAGNVIDFGVYHELSDQQVLDSLYQAMTEEIAGNFTEFQQAVENGSNILYIADNAGEIVADKMFINLISPDKVTLAVRGYPTLNDVTREDAEFVGLSEIVNVIDNGFDAPGTVLHNCRPEFQEYFAKADLIIAKGQGNYETLSGVNQNIYFLLKAKCSAIASNIGCPVGTMILQHASERKI